MIDLQNDAEAISPSLHSSSLSPAPHSHLESVARPKQARSEETLKRLLDAAQDLIEERSIAELSIPEIVRRAGSSVGGFYARFKGKNELLCALEERFFLELAERLESVSDPKRWSHAPPVDEVVEACIHELMSVANQRRNLLIAFISRASHDADFRAEALRFRDQISQRITALVISLDVPMRHPDPRLAIDLGIQFALSLVLQQCVAGRVCASGQELSDTQLAKEIKRNFMAYVGIDSASD